MNSKEKNRMGHILMQKWREGVIQGKELVEQTLEYALVEGGDSEMLLSEFIDLVKCMELPEPNTKLFNEKFK